MASLTRQVADCRTRIVKSSGPKDRACTLPTSGERRNAACNRKRVHDERRQGPDHLHAGGALGNQAMNDPILDEIRRIRDAHAAKFNYDLDAIFLDIKEQERKSGLKFVEGVARQPDPSTPPTGIAAPVALDSPLAEAPPTVEPH